MAVQPYRGDPRDQRNIGARAFIRSIPRIGFIGGQASALTRLSNTTLWTRQGGLSLRPNLPLQKSPYRRGATRMAYGRRYGSYSAGRRSTTRRYSGRRSYARRAWPGPLRKGPYFQWNNKANGNFQVCKFVVNSMFGTLNFSGPAGSASILASSSSNEQVYYFQHRLMDAPNIANVYDKLFDQAKILGVEVNLVPRQTIDQVGTANAGPQYCYTSIDYDGAPLLPVGVPLIANMQGSKKWTMYQPIKFYYKPRAIQRFEGPDGAQFHMTVGSPWQTDLAQQAGGGLVGFFFAIPMIVGTTQIFQWDVNCVYTVAFKERIA